MQHFEFKSWKSLAILIAICFTFLALVIQAFQYLPDENNIKSIEEISEENIETSSKEDIETNSEEDGCIVNEEDSVQNNNKEEEEEEEPQRDIKKWSYRDRSLDKFSNDAIEEKSRSHHNIPKEPIVKHREVDIPELESINNASEENQAIDDREKLFQSLRVAQEYKRQKDYKKAIEAYNQYLKLCKDPYQKLEAYDTLAILYAIDNDYENAIGCAEQAYKINASRDREFLLTKLYYKSGDVDRATKHINIILQRDFEIE